MYALSFLQHVIGQGAKKKDQDSCGTLKSTWNILQVNKFISDS